MFTSLHTLAGRAYRGFVVALVLVAANAVVAAKDFTYQGVKYTVIDKDAKTCKASGYTNSIASQLILPETAYDGSTGYTLVSIGSSSFSGYEKLTSVVIPESVISIGLFAFEGCTSLPSGITGIGHSAFALCRSLTSITLPSGITEIGESAFSGCTSLTSITLPSGITKISWKAFKGCTSLASITLPSGITKISWQAFEGCTSLASITLPSDITTIESGAFIGCTSLTDIALPKGSLKNIGSRAFENCRSLKSITIPSSVTNIDTDAFSGCTGLNRVTVEGETQCGDRVFSGCTLKPLLIKERLYWDSKVNPFAEMNADSYIICRSAEAGKIREKFSGTVHTFDNPYIFSSITPLIFGVKFSIEANPYYEGEVSTAKATVSLARYNSQSDKIIDNEPASSFLKEKVVTGLGYKEKYILSILSEEAEPYSSHTFTTVTPEVSCGYTATQRTISINSVSATSDESVTPKPKIYVKTGKTSTEFTGKKITVKDLAMKTGYQLVYADYGITEVYAPDQWTKSISLKRSATVLGPTTVRLSGSYDAGDAVIVESGWEGIAPIDETVVTGRRPNNKYQFTYYVKTDDKRTFKATVVYATTPELELEIQAPKCVSSTNAIVAAKTNISEHEPGVGFQWKKYDAPASLPASEGYAVVCDGLIEGYIRNLQPTSYYNVRAFYKDANEQYYYSDWTTFDPSDFSFFEPTVRTYPIEEAGPTSAKLRGYALAGTDNIVSQGFQYWRTGAAGGSQKAAPASGVMTVEASGQVMTASLSNLTPGSVYAFRAYVETASGFTYGDEQSFETPELSGVDDVTTEAASVEPVGYFDLSGRRYSTPRKGLNIVLFSDGSSRKMFVR